MHDRINTDPKWQHHLPNTADVRGMVSAQYSAAPPRDKAIFSHGITTVNSACSSST